MAETKKTAAELYAQAQAAQQQLEQLRQQQPGAYESAYGAQIDALMAQLDSRPAFTYDINGDPLFRQYQEQYQRQGKAAMEDTMGTAAGLTGGYGNSYATTAASQAYQNYLSKLQDVAPALYAAAYDRYQDQGDALEKQLERLQGLETNAYNAWQAQAQANRDTQDQAFDYWRYLNDAAYQAQQDEQAQANWQQEFNAKYPPASGSGGSGGKSGGSAQKAPQQSQSIVSGVANKVAQQAGGIVSGVASKVAQAAAAGSAASAAQASASSAKRKQQKSSNLFRPVSK